jgi:hypothetical protein
MRYPRVAKYVSLFPFLFVSSAFGPERNKRSILLLSKTRYPERQTISGGEDVWDDTAGCVRVNSKLGTVYHVFVIGIPDGTEVEGRGEYVAEKGMNE